LLTARPLFAGPREMDVLVKIRDADLSVLERHGYQIPAELMAVLRRALSRRREERFPTTGDYVNALEEVVRRGRLGAGPEPLVEWLQRVGLVKASGKSGEHIIEGTPSKSPSGEVPLPSMRAGGSPNPKASGAQLIAQPVWGGVPLAKLEPFPHSNLASPTY